MRKNILWVEDEKDQFRAFSNSVSRQHNVDRAVDYTAALKKISEKQYDLYIVDIILPSGGQLTTHDAKEQLMAVGDVYYGIELIRHIRGTGLTHPIVVVTVVTEEDKIKQITDIDSNIRFIFKYFATPDHVKGVVDELFSTPSLEGETPLETGEPDV